MVQRSARSAWAQEVLGLIHAIAILFQQNLSLKKGFVWVRVLKKRIENGGTIN